MPTPPAAGDRTPGSPGPSATVVSPPTPPYGPADIAPGCLSPRDIQNLLAARLGTGSGVRMAEHLAACPSCRQELDDQREFAELRRLSADRDPPAPPDVPGHALDELIGKGGFGHVWRGRDTALGRVCAYKVMHAEHLRGAARDALFDEARVMAELDPHPNRVTVFQLVDGGDELVLVMQFFPGGSLGRQPLPLPWRRAVRYLTHACLGLAELHRTGRLHRDIKPSNLLLNTKTDVAVVADYGLAALVDEPVVLAGTSGYLAPELLTDPPSAKSDVFALAVTLFALTSGAGPFDTSDPYRGLIQARDEGWEHLAGAVAHLPEGVREALRAGLDPDPQRRPDLAGFLFLLQRADRGELVARLKAAARACRRPVRLRARLSTVTGRADPPELLAEADEGAEARLVELGGAVVVSLTVFADEPGHVTVLGVAADGTIAVLLPGPKRPFTAVGPGQPLNPFVMTLTPADPGDLLAVVWTRHPVSVTAAEWRTRVLDGLDLRRFRPSSRDITPLYQDDPLDDPAVVVFDVVPTHRTIGGSTDSDNSG